MHLGCILRKISSLNDFENHHSYFFLSFICYLVAQRPTLRHHRGHSFTHLAHYFFSFFFLFCFVFLFLFVCFCSFFCCCCCFFRFTKINTFYFWISTWILLIYRKPERRVYKESVKLSFFIFTSTNALLMIATANIYRTRSSCQKQLHTHNLKSLAKSQ